MSQDLVVNLLEEDHDHYNHQDYQKMEKENIVALN